MRLTMGLTMQQQQRLIMTPELRQAITVLQLPMMELKEYLEQEMLNNSALEVEEEDTERTAPEPEPAEAADQPTTAEWLDYLGDYEGDGAPVRRSADEPSWEGLVSQAPTLHDHLRSQLQLGELDRSGRRVAEYLIGNIDDHGYLSVEPAPVAIALGVPVALVEQVLAVVQSLDPPGVGARSLQECLCLQWTHINGSNPLVLPLIERHLDNLAAGRISRIADALGTSPAAVQVAIDEIRTLDPKPGRRFGSTGETRYVLPDVAVERLDGEYVVLVNDVLVPRLQVSPVYRSLLSAESNSDVETKGFVEQRVKAAHWLIRSVEHRRNTLYRVVESVVRLQRPFFDHGVRQLRPLTLRQVAERIGAHESTVSRAIAGKYLQTPQGLFELGFFFTSGVEGRGGEGVAAESVKRRISDLIAAEPPSEPMSDQALTDALVRQGLQIARRTVAKYREEMRLPASSRRRRYS